MRIGNFNSSDLFKTVYKQEKSNEFRTDIAGLRGIAVLMVTLCHFEIPGFGGGLHRSRHLLCPVGLLDHRVAGQGV